MKTAFNSPDIITMLICKIPSNFTLPKGGTPPLWKRGARGGFLNKFKFSFETINILAFIFFIFCFLPFAFAEGPHDLNNFLYSTAIKGPLQKGALYRVPLSEEILRNCAHGCADARIFDGDGKEIPYVLIESRGSSDGGETYPFEITDYVETHETETVSMRLPEKYRSINTIRISTQNRDFRKQVEVYGSRDLKTWSSVIKDSIWDFSSQIDLRKTEIIFPESDYRYYRLVLTNAKKNEMKDETIRLNYRGGTNYHEFDFSVENDKKGKFHISRVDGITPQSKVKPVYDEVVLTSFSSQKDGDSTVMDIEAAVPFERVSLDIANSYYFRKVDIYFSENAKKGSYRFITTGRIYSFPLSETIETRNLIECPDSSKGHYRFVIENRSNPSLDIKNVKFEWVRRNLYFIALSDSSHYTLWFGNSPLEKPEYDIVNFINQCNWHTHSARDLKLSQVTQNAKFSPGFNKNKKAAIEKTILTLIVILLVGVIGYWLYSLLKNVDYKKG